jgi:hypothetical protein
MRFADLIRQNLRIRDIATSEAEELRKALPAMPIIVIDNVIAYLCQHPDQQFNPELQAPPFPRFWMEYRYQETDGPHHVGMACVETRSPQWAINFKLYSFRPNLAPVALHLCRGRIDLDRNGKHDQGSEKTIEIPVRSPSDPIKPEDLGPFCAKWIFGIQMGIMFTHCRNVQRVEHVVPLKLAKRNAERGKPPMLKYQTLDIEPMKKILVTEGRIESEGLQRALHLCRGHFAHYPESGPGLFGRGIHGQFWIPAHARGTEKSGVVISDYSVAQPKEE